MMKDRALQSQHNISVSGGNQVARYFVSAGFLDQDGLFRTFDKDPNTNFSYKRYNYRANLDLSLGKYHELSINLGGRVENKHSLSSREACRFESCSGHYSTRFSFLEEWRNW